MELSMDLNNRTAVITGATGGLGSALTHELAARGMRLALLGTDGARLDALVRSLSLPVARLVTQCVNLLNLAETKSAAETIASKFGRIDILLHVVGGWTGGKTLLEAPVEDLAFMLNQHVWTSFNVIQAFVPHLVRNHWGRVVMVTSPSSLRPSARGGLYAAGKAGQEALMLSLSQELAGSGVTANLLQARTIDIKHEKNSTPSLDNSTWTTPEELIAAILYLISDEAGTINGARIPLFGSYA
jgi:NAD(P)-dependent dehydrogenase (short-subunit alcohol dehydrogenase family)